MADTSDLSGATDIGDTGCTSHQFSIDLPSNYVPDSEHAVISVTGAISILVSQISKILIVYAVHIADYMGPTVSGLEKLLRLPTGCGEQNMLNFAPAVYITRYLSTLNELNDETAAKSLRYMQTGIVTICSIVCLDPLP